MKKALVLCAIITAIAGTANAQERNYEKEAEAIESFLEGQEGTKKETTTVIGEQHKAESKAQTAHKTVVTTETSIWKLSDSRFFGGTEVYFVPYEETMTSFLSLVAGFEVQLTESWQLVPRLGFGMWRPDVNKDTTLLLFSPSLELGFNLSEWVILRGGAKLYLLQGRYEGDDEIMQGNLLLNVVLLPHENFGVQIGGEVSTMGTNYYNKTVQDTMGPDFYVGVGLLLRTDMFSVIFDYDDEATTDIAEVEEFTGSPPP